MSDQGVVALHLQPDQAVVRRHEVQNQAHHNYDQTNQHGGSSQIRTNAPTGRLNDYKRALVRCKGVRQRAVLESSEVRSAIRRSAPTSIFNRNRTACIWSFDFNWSHRVSHGLNTLVYPPAPCRSDPADIRVRSER